MSTVRNRREWESAEISRTDFENFILAACRTYCVWRTCTVVRQRFLAVRVLLILFCSSPNENNENTDGFQSLKPLWNNEYDILLKLNDVLDKQAISSIYYSSS